MLRMPALTSLNAFTPSTPWAVTTPRYSATGRPSIPGVVVTSIPVPSCLPLCSAQLVLALDLTLDVLFGDLRPPEDIPRVHHHADAPSDDEEHWPEEPMAASDRPDHHHERV